MIKPSSLKRLAFGITCFSMFSTLHAAQPKFTLTPLTPTTISIPANGVGMIQYRVTNQTKITRTLTMAPIQGVTQITAPAVAGACANPFTLASNESCILTLSINGAQISGNIISGPQVCKTRGAGDNSIDPYLCSQPTQEALLNVTRVVSEQAAISVNPSNLNLVASEGAQSLVVTNNSTTVTATNIKAELAGTALEGKVLQNASACATLAPGHQCLLTFTPGANAQTPTSLNIQGSNTKSITAQVGITLTLAYISNNQSSPVSQCRVDSITGNLNDCVTSEALAFESYAPRGVAVNAAGTFLYVVDASMPAVYVCKVNPSNGNLTCEQAFTDITILKRPRGIALDSSGTHAYIANIDNDTVLMCTIDPAFGYFTDCKNSRAQGLLSPQGVTFNAANTIAYISNGGNDTVSACSRNPSTALLSGCVRMEATDDQNTNLLNGPRLLAIEPGGATAYIPNYSGNNIIKCSIDQQTGRFVPNSCSEIPYSAVGGPVQIVFSPINPAISYVTNFGSVPYPPDPVVVPSVSQCSANLAACSNSGAVPPSLALWWGISFATLGKQPV